MSDVQVPRVFISYAHDSVEHKREVLQLAEYLRVHEGLDVRLDRWDDHIRRSWAFWAETELLSADYTLVIASPHYRRRAAGETPPSDGRGVKYEILFLREQMTKDLDDATRRILPVVLAGREIEDVPAFLQPYSTTRYHVNSIDEAGVAELVSAITGIGEVRRPERGVWRGATRTAPRPGQQVLAGLTWVANSPDTTAGEAWIDGVRYERSAVVRRAGAGGPAESFLEVELGGRYRRFQAAAGVLDDAAQKHQVCLLRAFLDGDLAWEGMVSLGKLCVVEVDVTCREVLRLEAQRIGFGGPARARGASTGALDLAWGNPTLI